MMRMDFTIYKALNDLAAGHDRLEDVLRFVASDAQFFFIAVLAILFFARGKWRSVNVQIQERQDVTARTKQGYYSRSLAN